MRVMGFIRVNTLIRFRLLVYILFLRKGPVKFLFHKEGCPVLK